MQVSARSKDNTLVIRFNNLSKNMNDRIILPLLEADKSLNFPWDLGVETSYETVVIERSTRSISVPKLVEQSYQGIYFPEFAEARFYTLENFKTGVVAKLLGRKWKIYFTPVYDENSVYGKIPETGLVEFEKCCEAEKESVFTTPKEALTNDGNFLRNDEICVQLFGQPNFQQMELLIEMKGENHPLPVLLVLWHDFGDCGTWNIFADFNEDNIPVKIFFEYSMA